MNDVLYKRLTLVGVFLLVGLLVMSLRLGMYWKREYHALLTNPPVEYVESDIAEPWPEWESNDQMRDTIVAREARRAGVPVELALAVSHVENWTGDSLAVSTAGAVGLMQIMPRVWGTRLRYECYGYRSIVNPERNACLGVRILQYYHMRWGDWNQALRAYNGARLNKPAGDRYVMSVLAKLEWTHGNQ